MIFRGDFVEKQAKSAVRKNDIFLAYCVERKGIRRIMLSDEEANKHRVVNGRRRPVRRQYCRRHRHKGDDQRWRQC